MGMATPARVGLPLPDQPPAIQLTATIKPKGGGTVDLLQCPDDVYEWLDAVGFQLTGEPAQPADLEDARALRAAIHRVLAEVTRDTREFPTQEPSLPSALDLLNSAAARAPKKELLADGETITLSDGRTPSTVGAALTRLAEDAIDTLGGPDAPLLRACYAPNCMHYFVATNPGREWCSATCGNRVRAARHYSKLRAASR